MVLSDRGRSAVRRTPRNEADCSSEMGLLDGRPLAKTANNQALSKVLGWTEVARTPQSSYRGSLLAAASGRDRCKVSGLAPRPMA